ncbi:hypothetical protein MKW92_004378 [Papaver armeniacum]|nr:hypothetical protein MKW92_004378 [Papaver armeniacum]
MAEQESIALCMCKGTEKYVHSECLDHWRSIKKMANVEVRFFVARDIFAIFIFVQLVHPLHLPIFCSFCARAISLLAYLVYLVDASQNFALRRPCDFWCSLYVFLNQLISGDLLLFVLVGKINVRVRGDLAQPCRLLTECCLNCGCRDPRCPAACLVSCYQGLTSAGDCACLPFAGEGASLFIIGIRCRAIIALVLFAFFGLIYSILVATIAGQKNRQRHYHILAKMMLTKDVDGLATDSNWFPPPLPPEHVEQLKALGLL